ncbi:unnamed protein product [Rotaria sordida]|uniref:Wax synthase domain-containing protein n=1 Tax=Rotaria sordida TaxID=392033 RepID=A0A814CKY7_9BILA|nr:unnamed protein product [Rotaria sordida]CAF1148399.1 unnamed protein product [Rotaria sordida]CAF1148707.1 unnamed protein product [Rotaria sordida]CAF1384821.1 unnamed protein product [Rotaria sordida]CAF1385132.1 unnamed protein product [Rotaria sordida]
MVLSPFVLIGWFGHVIICYCLIRPICNTLVRTILTIIPCISFPYSTCQNFPQYDSLSLMILILCWMISIRLIHLTIFSIDKFLTFRSFLFKILWIFLPILPLKSKRDEWPIKYYLILIPVKFVSLREFWSQRYNRFIGTVLKESIFEPIHSKFSSSTIEGLTTFIISGLLHVHVAFVAFDDVSTLFPTFIFFFLHGIGCCFETKMKIQLPKYIGWILTHAFLLLTAPLVLEPSIKRGPPLLIPNPPPLVNIEWIPKLPIPNFCP